ncbi:WW domain-containing transcription regulator protein 1 isoform X1 [Acipenser oxyrinchus oxyrinchus]|uniref:WW domain-containing transcription regulator protein 1 isoform X1 n=1 Tax=Acipenser oxyrinchus oxyrinchus TaxID=40147 RepID=A0AAD8D7J6_ACIOX|nr:WW domain-containing transcription regulator protein 1 isoform X1 [Acipenser oxyrinchus oxyrinchus]
MNTNSLHPLPGQQVIHVAQDLDTDLEQLFNSVMNPKPSSWRKKLLPESFFKEPESGSHSRQSSTDSGSLPPRLTVQHVRSHSSPASLQLGTGASGTPSPAQHAHLRQQSFDVADELQLPPGWEMAFTPSGQRYFLNHMEKITTWQDPRKTMSQAMNQMSLHPPATSTPMQQRSMAMSQPNLVMNHHHQQQQQQQMTTSPPVSQQNLPTPNAQAGMMNLPNALTAQQQLQQKMRLQRIQLERERIRMRQEELMRQEVALCRQLPMESDNMAQVQTAVNTPAMTQDMRTMPTNGSDPFLNSGPYHSREQSTDSGLGLGCYSIPTTPEDFLNNVDEMDTGESMAQTTMSVNHQSRFPDFLDSLPGTNVDLGTLEGEDLIPILNDVESVLNKSEPFLTWL